MHVLTRSASYLSRFFLAVENLGFVSSVKLFALYQLKITVADAVVDIKKLRRHIHFRGAKDMGVMGHFFHPGYHILDTTDQPARFIIDAGAHIGDEAIRFRHFHPEALIVALEPEPDNYRILVQNTRDDEKTIPLQNALWSHSLRLKIHRSSNSEGHWVSEASERDCDVAAVSICDLMDRFGYSEVDILKLDIEGAEAKVFETNLEDWIHRVRVVIFECPDNDQPGSTFRIFQALSGQEFNCYIQGENIVRIRADTGWRLETGPPLQ